MSRLYRSKRPDFKTHRNSIYTSIPDQMQSTGPVCTTSELKQFYLSVLHKI